MPHPQVTLDVAAFLDSPRAKALDGPKPDEVRKIVGSFLGVCYEDLGKAPKLLDGQDLHTALGHLLPSRLKRKDPLAEHVPAVLEAWLEHLIESEVVTQSFELKNALASTMQEFQETVRTGENPHHHHHHERQEPFVHKAEKLGRNDPCFCGSGKKFKKCHGKNA